MCLGIRVVVRPKPRKIGRRTLFAEVLEASRSSTAFQVRGAARGQGRTHGDQRTWWRGLRIAARRKISTLHLLVQVTGFLANQASELLLHKTKLMYNPRHHCNPGHEIRVL